MVETRVCTKCLETKPVTKFYKKERSKNKDAKYKYYSRCKPCWLILCKEWRDTDGNGAKVAKRYFENNSERYYERDLYLKYGLTLPEYKSKFDSQDGLCKICGGESDRRLDVDHNHTTGQVRDLLCRRCNQLIGHCGESVELLKEVIQYLERWNG